MRCSNCGWDNPTGLTKCEKCGTPLSDGVVQSSYSGTARESANASYAGTAMEGCADTPAFSKTVCEASVFGSEVAAEPSPQPSVHNGRCPQCGYPLRQDATVCPKCHYVFGQQAPKSSQSTEQEKPQQDVFQGQNPNDARTPFGGTVMPGMNRVPDIWCSLTPMPIQGERETPEKVEFEGKRHELNRANTDAKNHTITSKVQAILEYNDSKKRWYIQDQSTLQSTFLCCADEVPIVDGDVLLMGDRRFVFHAVENTPNAAPQQVLGTIAVGRQHVSAPRCVLTPLIEEGEQDAPQEQNFRGDAHLLNRANLDPENYTITSKVQAELTCENGQWYIKDRSQLQTTYILCQDPMDLKDGDSILMGNRVFTFNC